LAASHPPEGTISLGKLAKTIAFARITRYFVGTQGITSGISLLVRRGRFYCGPGGSVAHFAIYAERRVS
jgi:hypothetical protein